VSAGLAPLVNGILWSFAIGFGCWLVVQLMEVVETSSGERPPAMPETMQETPAAGARHH
jgi:hypothetical protein